MRRFVAKHHLDRFRANPHFPVNTLKMMRGAVAAQALDCFAPYVEAMFVAMWEEGRDMDNPEEIAGVLRSAGLDALALIEKSADPEIKARLQHNTQRAYERGAFGSPIFFVGDEMYFGKDRLGEVETETIDRTSTPAGQDALCVTGVSDTLRDQSRRPTRRCLRSELCARQATARSLAAFALPRRM